MYSQVVRRVFIIVFTNSCVDMNELLGFSIGDGHIFYSKRHNIYRLELVGNVEEDYDYFVQLKKFLEKNTSKKVYLAIRKDKKGQSLRLSTYDKIFVDNLINLGLRAGKKTFTIQFPKNKSMNEKKALIKGLFEADGCLYFSKSKKISYPTYPRIEIKTSSIGLLMQLKEIFQDLKFLPYIKKPASDRTFAIVLSGEKALEKWRQLIGFNSLKNKTKYELWKKLGYYIPNTPITDRIRILSARPDSNRGKTALQAVAVAAVPRARVKVS